MIETDIDNGTVVQLQPDVLGVLPDRASQPEIKQQETELQNRKDEDKGELKDHQDLNAEIRKIRLIFLVLGILSLLPWNILLNAEGFFRKKLSNTYFENNFSLFLQASAVFSNLLGSFLMFFLSKMFPVRKLVLVATLTFSLPLIVVTALAKINTDTWKIEFFVIILIMYSINAVSHGLMTSAHSILCTMIEPSLLKTYYVGKGLAGLAGSAVALSTLAFPTVDVVSAAFYYFMMMTILTLIGATALIIYFLNLDLVKQRTMKQNYMKEEERSQEELMSLKDITVVIKTQCISGLLATISSLLVFPATLTNLQSVNPKPGTDWTDKFFLPVTVFLVWAIGDNAGKILTEFVNWPKKEMMVWFAVGRLVMIPLTIMTNIQPRKIPIWFNSDVIPSVLCFLTSFTGGYLVNLNLTYAPGYVKGKENQGRASMVMFFFIAAGLALGSGSIFLIPVIINT
ncbi:hypothetical protein ACHWQZ_G018278 [Mnemiopsis leidyi]